jgi:hypothetical protein
VVTVSGDPRGSHARGAIAPIVADRNGARDFERAQGRPKLAGRLENHLMALILVVAGAISVYDCTHNGTEVCVYGEVRMNFPLKGAIDYDVHPAMPSMDALTPSFRRAVCDLKFSAGRTDRSQRKLG